MQNSFIFLQVGKNHILGHHHSIMEALCKVVTGERNDFIFHFDNWVKQIPGSSAKVLCPHSYPRDLLSNQEMLQGEEKQILLSVASCNWDAATKEKRRGQLWPRVLACSVVSRKVRPECPGPSPLPRAHTELTVRGASVLRGLCCAWLDFIHVQLFFLTIKFNLFVGDLFWEDPIEHLSSMPGFWTER